MRYRSSKIKIFCNSNREITYNDLIVFRSKGKFYYGKLYHVDCYQKANPFIIRDIHWIKYIRRHKVYDPEKIKEPIYDDLIK